MKVPRALIFIFILALFIRVYQLGTLPIGFHADEVRVGWNAYSILKTLKDDRGNLFALYYNTFGDYRPTGIFYLTIPSLLLFGINEFAVRFPSAFLGALTVFPLYFLAIRFTKQKNIALLSSFFIALSPWHISASRATSEVVISMFFALCAMALLNNRKAIYSVVLFGTSYLFYHSIRLLAPVFLLIIFLSTNKKRNQLFLTFIAVAIFTCIFAISPGSRGRFSQVSILQSNEQVLGTKTSTMIFDAPVFAYIKDFAEQYSSYFSGAFLLGDAAKPIRYKTPDIGMLTFAELIFAGIGVFLTLKKKANPLILLLLLCAPIAAALTHEDAPNLHRALFMIPFLSILAACGSIYLLNRNRFLMAIIFVFFGAQWIFFWNSYATRSAYIFSGVRNEKAKDLALYLNEVHENYDEIIITNDPDSLYPWYAFFAKKDPHEFNTFAIKRTEGEWRYQNLLFTEKLCPSGDIFHDKQQEPLKKKVLVVDGFNCAIESKIKDGMQAKVVKQFGNPDGSVAYTLWEKMKR